MTSPEGARPDYCCGVCPPFADGGYDCTCMGNPRCPSGKKAPRVWFNRPQIWWPRWTPIWRSHDEYGRHTLVIGWTFTGQIIIAACECRDPECKLRMLQEMHP